MFDKWAWLVTSDWWMGTGDRSAEQRVTFAFGAGVAAKTTNYTCWGAKLTTTLSLGPQSYRVNNNPPAKCGLREPCHMQVEWAEWGVHSGWSMGQKKILLFGIDTPVTCRVSWFRVMWDNYVIPCCASLFSSKAAQLSATGENVFYNTEFLISEFSIEK